MRWVLLLLILAAAAVLRFTGINWDRFQHVHPDERFIVWVADTVRWPADAGAVLDPARSPLNPLRWPPDPANPDNPLAGRPRNYAYGHFPLYLLVFSARLAQAAATWLGVTTLAFPAWMQPLHTVGRQLASYAYLPLVGRALSALADLGTLLLVYALARRLVHDVEGAPSAPARGRPGSAALSASLPLLAAAAYGFAVLPIQLSHYAAVDAVLTFCVTATLALAVRRAGGGGWASWLLAGAMAGLAVGSKFSAVLLAVPLLVAGLYRLPAGSTGRKLAVAAGRMAAAAAAALLAFAVTNPFALIEARAYLTQIAIQNTMVSGAMDAPYTRQYIGTLPYIYFVQQLSQWGLGWPLGIAAWGGFIWAIARALRWRLGAPGPALAILLAWAVPYFATTGVFHTKFLRYMAPLLPCLLVFAAGGAAVARRWLAARFGRPGRAVWVAAAGVTLAVAAAWALAFVGVYRQEHPWIAASKWIYGHVPQGARLLTEHWDDALPLALDELTPRPAKRVYESADLPLWEPDTPEKLDALVTDLSAADYLILASNRLYAPIQRLPARYPMSSQYYRMLFAGDLGYQLVAEFTVYPELLGVTIRDDHADESFTVYDHPHVLIFENTGRLKPELLRARLGRYLPAGETRAAPRGRPPGLARIAPQTAAPGPALLDQPVDTLPVVADFRWNRAATASTPLATLLWWLAVSLFGWAAWPLLFPALRGLADRGYGLARPAGWLLVGWVHWLGVSLRLWENRLLPIAAILGLLLVAGLAAWRVQRRAIGAFWAGRRRLLLGSELLFGLAYLAFVGVRLLNPDLWQPWNGGEKFMESAFLNAILRSAHFPPYDPYFAGGVINYYYYGFYLVSLPIKLTGIAPEVAFNLATPALFALTAGGVFSVAYALAAPRRGGDGARMALSAVPDTGARTEPSLLGPLQPRARPALSALLSVGMALLLGNLRGAEWFVETLGSQLRGVAAPRYDYWAASRVIPNTINEFPLWTFTFADLHPHLIAMPFGLLVVGVALNWALVASRGPEAGGQETAEGEARTPWLPIALSTGLLLALSLGALGAINTWDLPTYGLLVTGAVLSAGWRRAARRPWLSLPAALGALLLVAALSAAAYLPFHANYAPTLGDTAGPLLARYLNWVRAASPLGDWLTVWGVWLFLVMSYLVASWWARRPARGGGGPRRDGPLFALLALIGVLAVLAALGRPTAALALLPSCLLLPAIFDRRLPAEQNFVALAVALALAVIAGTELVYVRDFLEGGEWYRMNTLFKFSTPAWLLLGAAGGPMLCRTWAAARRGPLALGVVWQGAMVVLLVSSLSFLAAGVRARVDDRFPGRWPPFGTLDGTAYMAVSSYAWPDAANVIDLAYEREAIRWLLANVRGTPVVAEAPAGWYTVDGQPQGYDYYRAGGLRVASLTGLPTLLGAHQGEQRSGAQVGQRSADGQALFATTDIAWARALLRDLRVGYVYIGHLERTLFDSDALRKFDIMVELGDLEVVYRNPQVTIYRAVSAHSGG